MRKRDQEKFAKQAERLIEKLGGTITGECGYIWTLETKHGPLHLNVSVNSGNDGPFTVFTRFDDPKRAHPTTGCNPYSGKWNHHYLGNWAGDAALLDLERHLEEVANMSPLPRTCPECGKLHCMKPCIDLRTAEHQIVDDRDPRIEVAFVCENCGHEFTRVYRLDQNV